MERKAAAKADKANQAHFDALQKEIRGQFGEQIRCLEGRTETQTAILGELQDFFRRRAEIEAEYGRGLEKLAKSTLARHKEAKAKREPWSQHGMTGLLQELLESTKVEARDRASLADLYSLHVLPKLANQAEDLGRISRKSRDVALSAQAEISRVLNELHTAMKTYQLCQAEAATAEGKFRLAAQQRGDFAAKNPGKSGGRKAKLLDKEAEKRQVKYAELRLKGLKARNEYLLCVDAANAALHQYFASDLSDLMDASDLGLAQWISALLVTVMAARKALQESESQSLSRLRDFADSHDSRTDKQRFLEAHTGAFMLPRRFDFRPQGEDPIRQVSAQKPVDEELMGRLAQMERRLADLRTESEEVWKTLETAEQRVLHLQQAPVVCVADLFSLGNAKGGSSSSPYASSMGGGGGLGTESKRSICREPEIAQQKRKHDLAETEDFYMDKFRHWLLTANLVQRLSARSTAIKSALGGGSDGGPGTGLIVENLHRLRVRREDSVDSECGPVTPLSSGGSEAGTESLLHPPPSLPPKPSRKKRIGEAGRSTTAAPRLFGGSLEEYVEGTGEEIPLVVRSCIRLLSAQGLHHQGVFRVSGSQLEIAALKEAFERGSDPLAEAQDPNQVNAAAGCLKAYFRELREPLFPIYLFDQFTEATQCPKSEFLGRFRELLAALPRPNLLLLRYLFAFLGHLSEFADENCMDPYNLAICFGPTLMPIPEGKDQVLYHNHVNELMRNLILHADNLFPPMDGPAYGKFGLELSEEGAVLEEARDSLDVAPDEYAELESEKEPPPPAPQPQPQPPVHRLKEGAGQRTNGNDAPLPEEQPYEVWHKRTSAKKSEGSCGSGSPSKSSVKLSLHKVAPVAEPNPEPPTPPVRQRNGRNGSGSLERKRLSLQSSPSNGTSPPPRQLRTSTGDEEAIEEIQSELKAVLHSLQTFTNDPSQRLTWSSGTAFPPMESSALGLAQTSPSHHF